MISCLWNGADCVLGGERAEERRRKYKKNVKKKQKQNKNAHQVVAGTVEAEISRGYYCTWKIFFLASGGF